MINLGKVSVETKSHKTLPIEDNGVENSLA